MLIAALVAAALVIALAAITLIGVRMIERAHPPSGRFITVNGTRLHVLELGPKGHGLPIVLLHGASGTLEDMRLALGERLAQHHRVVLIDRPGHGWSDHSEATVGPARQSELIA